MDSSVLRCEVHSAETVRYYCAGCVAPLCTVCALEGHRDHVTMELSEALGDKRETIANKIQAMSGKVQKYEELLIQLEELEGVREAALKKSKAEVERHSANLITQIQLQRDQLLEQLEDAHKGGTKQLQLERENASVQLANMKSLWKFAAKLTEPSQAVQLIAMYGDLVKMAESMVKAPDPCILKECIMMGMFVPRESLVVGDLSKCELSTELLTRVSEESERSRSQSPFSMPRQRRSNSPFRRAGTPTGGFQRSPGSAPSSRSHSPVPFELDCVSARWHSPRLLWKIDKTGSRRGEINEAYDVAVMDTGDVVVAEWLSQRLQVFDATGYSKEVIGQSLLKPWGVCISPDGNLALTDEKDRTLKVYSSHGYLVAQWKRNIFGWPRGLVANRSGQYIVSDGRCTLGIYLPDGKCLKQFGSQGSGNEQFDWPRYVATDSDDRIIVSDSSNHCIKVLDSMGQFMFKFGSQGSNDGQMKHPRGVCTDLNDNIIVADQDNDRVTLFTPEGKFIRHIVKIQKPWGVALNNEGIMAVTQKPSLCVFKVFEPKY